MNVASEPSILPPRTGSGSGPRPRFISGFVLFFSSDYCSAWPTPWGCVFLDVAAPKGGRGAKEGGEAEAGAG